MAEIDTGSEMAVGRHWGKSLALAAICAGLVAVSWYGMGIEPRGYRERRFHELSFVIFPVFALFGPWVIYRLFVPWGAPVRIGPEGFCDLRAGRRAIPWRTIRNVVRRGSFVQLTLERGFARDYPWSWTQKALKRLRKSAGPTHLLVAEWCLADGFWDLPEVLEAYRAAHG